MMTAPAMPDVIDDDDDGADLDAHAQFTREALGHRLLTAREERAYARRWRESGHTDTAARDALLVHNLCLVYAQARRYTTRSLTRLDLVQEGVLGLLHAIDGYDPDRGTRFSTHAVPWIRQAMERAVVMRDPLIQVPYDVYHQNRRLLREDEPHGGDYRAVAARAVAGVGSLDVAARVGENSAARAGTEWCSVGDLLADDAADGDAQADALCEEDECGRLWREVLAPLLTARERQAIRLRYGFGSDPVTRYERATRPIGRLASEQCQGAINALHAYEDVARLMGCSKGLVQQLEASALRKLRGALARDVDATTGAVSVVPVVPARAARMVA